MKRPPCPHMVDAIEALAAGLEPDSGVREHLLECPACNGYFREQKRFDDLLGETAGAMEDPWLATRPRRRALSPWRITAVAAPVAAAVAVVVALAAILGMDHRPGGESKDSPGAVAEAPAGQQESVAPGTVADDQDPSPREPATVQEETRLTTTAGEQLVRSFKGGLRLSLSGQGDVLVQRTGTNAYRLALRSGVLVGDVPHTDPRMRVDVVADNMQVRVTGTLFSVEACDGRITRVEVERGQVVVENTLTRETRTLTTDQQLEVEPVAVSHRPADSPSLLMSFLVEIPMDEVLAKQDDPSVAHHAHKKTPASKQAPEKASPYDKAMQLRKEGNYEEAVQAFLSAAAITAGITQERCYYQAASLSLVKLDDPARTITLSSSYMKMFPKGFFVEEVMLLMARAHLKASEPEKARSVLVDYIETYSDGSHQALAHLLLGKIFATTYGNCKSAESHLLYVEQSEPGTAWATQARKILDYCATR